MNQPNNSASSQKSTIGKTIKIDGNIDGAEDIVINGSVDGAINFSEHNVSIGEEGNITANVVAKNITVSGEIKGELRAREQVTVQACGRLIGDIHAPRVVLKDGCQFKGSVDMTEKSGISARSRNGTAKLGARKSPISRPAAERLTPEHPTPE